MAMTPDLRKLALTAHVTASVGWLGAVAAYLALVLTALSGQDAQTVQAAWIAMEVIARFVIVPLSLAALLSGLVQSQVTAWGLLRHYWVLAKLLLTLVATTVLLLHLPAVSHFAGVAAGTTAPNLGGLRGELLHAGGGLLVLLATTALSVYKPAGLTPYGWRKQQEQRTTSRPGSVAPRGK
jgi:hypothetical protein